MYNLGYIYISINNATQNVDTTGKYYYNALRVCNDSRATYLNVRSTRQETTSN